MRLVNGAPVELIPATDRGLAYGDGVFRTLRAVDGRPLHWPRHFAKLKDDCAALSIPCPAESMLLNEVQSAVIGLAQATVKILVTRGSGPRGYSPPPSCAPTRIVMAEPCDLPQEKSGGVRIHLCRLRLAHQPALAGIKHLNRLENVLARAEWNDPTIAEGLMLDHDGCVIGGTMSNLFLVEQGGLATPDLSRCGVAGVTRARVIDIAARLRIACRVENLPWQRVLDADEVFVVNSVIGLWPVSRMATNHWPVGKTTVQIRQALKDDDAAAALA